MAELVDVQDLGSCAERRVGSNPTTRTKKDGAPRARRPFLSRQESVLTGQASHQKWISMEKKHKKQRGLVLWNQAPLLIGREGLHARGC